ncbi:hypothetical protein AVEN_43458-1 [Araneus ventricosus]|uniref:Uncharacterized protein n=1 Tax=Araneus ventricosus TaxID=182803 RepID=A0A4Y2W4Q5_ARAVE|nr:hypothetical protein AVEN_43458-1 [Araneus ventricosus]
MYKYAEKPPYALVSLQYRVNLSPFTKDYRGEEQLNEPKPIFGISLRRDYTSKIKHMVLRRDSTNHDDVRCGSHRSICCFRRLYFWPLRLGDGRNSI